MPLYPLNNSDRRLSTEDSFVTDPFFGQENGKNPFISPLRDGAKTPESKEKSLPDEQNIPSWLTIFAELSHSIKDSLEKIKSVVHLSREKIGDAEYADYFHKTISEHISKTEAVLNCFTTYLKINSPLPRVNTVHLILEEALKFYEKTFADKKIKVFKKQFEENLPETSLHDEQLKFIINSILQYAIPSIPPHGKIGFLTRSFESQEVVDGGKSPLQKNEKYIEVLTGFTGCQNGRQQLETILVNPASPHKEKDDFILHLVEEIIKMNRGMMEIKADDEKLMTMISLILPMEKRRTVHYQSTTA